MSGPRGVLLEARDLAVTFPGPTGPVRAVDGVDLSVAEGESVGLVGRSGAGKTLTALALLGLVPPPGRIADGSSVRFRGDELVGAPASTLRAVRGREIGMVFQDPAAALNPVLTVGEQIAEVLRVVKGDSRSAARAGAEALLDEVGVPDAARRLDAYPHEFSGGMRQRVVLAGALAGDPSLLVADEPTSALDLTVQATILGLLDALRTRRRMALLLVSHDLALVAERCERVLVMEDGRVVERGAPARVFGRPEHSHTRELVRATPVLSLEGDHGAGRDAPDPPRVEPLIELVGVSMTFAPRRAADAPVHAVRDLSLEVGPGESVALVGESGAGKSTAVLMALGLLRPDSGSVRYRGRDLAGLDRDALLNFRRRVQVVFQDGYGALDPRQRVGPAIEEVLRVHGLAAGREQARVVELLERVELPGSLVVRRPSALSGGERQRVGIARALAVEPELLVLDEPVSALDVHVQARVLALLRELRSGLGLAFLLVAHDLALVQSFADRIVVLERGRAVETGATRRVLRAPDHPATRALVAAHPPPSRAPDRSGGGAVRKTPRAEAGRKASSISAYPLAGTIDTAILHGPARRSFPGVPPAGTVRTIGKALEPCGKSGVDTLAGGPP